MNPRFTEQPATGALQEHQPALMQKLIAEQAKEQAARNVGTFKYTGPQWTWMVGTNGTPR